jgi:hypothetical protein
LFFVKIYTLAESAMVWAIPVPLFFNSVVRLDMSSHLVKSAITRLTRRINPRQEIKILFFKLNLLKKFI